MVPVKYKIRGSLYSIQKQIIVYKKSRKINKDNAQNLSVVFDIVF